MRKPLFHFLVLGFLLFVGRSLAGDGAAPPAPIEVDAAQIAALEEGWSRRLGRAPNPVELDALVRQFIDDEILFREGVAAGLIEADGVVQRRLLQNARFLGMEESSDAQLLDKAHALGMHMTDPVVRRRLIQLMRSAIFAGARAEKLDHEEQELRARYDAALDRFVVAPRLRISHVFVGRDRSGEEDERAAALRERILREQLPPEDAIRLGDSFLRGHRLALLSQRELEGYFGPAFAADLFGGAPGELSQPIESAYGLHLVWIEESRAQRQQEFEEVRERIRDDWLREREQARLRNVLDTLRDDYEIRVAGSSDGARS